MKDNKIIYGILGLILGAGLMWTYLNSTLNISFSGNYRNEKVAQKSMHQNSNIDAHFIEQMIPHHEDAIKMAKLAEQKAAHQEIKTLAGNIIDSQSKENTQMKDWYKQWFGKEVPLEDGVSNGMMNGGMNMMHMGMMNDSSDITALENAENFDKAFIEQMIPHHQMAIMMASMLKNSTDRPEMKQLAEDIIKAQSKEISEMRSWYKNWGY